jgi:small subunit ribosomal protein S1
MATDQELSKTSTQHEEFQALLDKDFAKRSVKEGQIIKATVTEITPKYIVCDASLKAEAMIDKSEFTNDELEKLKVNDVVEVFLDRVENFKGQVVISRSKAKQMKGWESIVKIHKEDKICEGKIKTKIKGGMIVEINGFSCFMPSSQLALSPTKNIEKFFNTPLKFKIIKVDASRGNAICSRRQVLSDDKDIETKELIKGIKEGQKITAVCSGITAWGAFFQYQNGLVLLAHISDLAWSRIKHPSEVLSIGDERELLITKIDSETNRVSCSIKDLVESPFKNLEKKYEIGKIQKNAKVTRILDYGIFFELEPAVEALCHKSECSYTETNVIPKKITAVGKTHDVKIISVEPGTNKISVSLKIGENPYDKLKEKLNTNIKIKVEKKIDKAIIGIIEESKISTFLHWKECSYNEKVENLEKFKKGDVLTVRLKEIDGTKVKVSLREANEKDPWSFFKDNNKKIGDIITTRVIEVLKTGAIKVAADPDKKIVTTIKKSDLAKDASDARSDIFSGGEKLDSKIMELDFNKRIIKLSPREAQLQEEAGLIKKFGKNATKSGQTLASIFKKAMGKKEEKK